MPRRKDSRRPSTARSKRARNIPRPIGITGGGQGGFIGGPASGGLW